MFPSPSTHRKTPRSRGNHWKTIGFPCVFEPLVAVITKILPGGIVIGTTQTLPDTTNIYKDLLVVGPEIPDNTTISSITDTTHFELTNVARAGAPTTISLTFGTTTVTHSANSN